MAGHAMVRCAWRAGWRQCTRRRKACHSTFVSFDVRRLFAAVARSFAANCFSPVSPVCSQTAPPTPSFAIPRTTAGLVPLSFASNEVNVKICGGYWGGTGKKRARPVRPQPCPGEQTTNRKSINLGVIHAHDTWGPQSRIRTRKKKKKKGMVPECRVLRDGPFYAPRGACRPGDGTSCGASKQLLVGTSVVFFVIVGGAV